MPRPEDPTPPDPAHTFVTYTYDPVGNRLTEANHLGTTSYTCDGADWLTSRSGAFPGGIDPTPTTNRGVWSSGAAGYLGDDDYATVAPAKNQTRTHHYGAFDMDAITAEASIDRVTVTVEWAVSSASAQATLAAQAFVGGNPVSSPLTNTSRPTSDTVQSFEVAGLTRCQLASGTFEVAVSASRGGGGASFTARLDAVSVSVEYTGGSQEFTYDANGNQLTAAADTFSWDQANRLVSATANGVTETYVYAGDGRRLSVTSAGDTVDWLWDLNHPLPQLAVERDDTGQVLRRSTYGIGRIATAVGSDLAYHHHDGLGSMVDLTDPAGDALAWAEFQPFGAVRTWGLAASAPELPFGFTGEFTDPTGLIHLRARQYDPAAGRFLSTHPVAPLLTDPYVGTNVYVQNNPALVASTVVSQEVAGRECLNEGRFALAAGAITAAIRIKSWIRAWLFGVVIKCCSRSRCSPRLRRQIGRRRACQPLSHCSLRRAALLRSYCCRQTLSWLGVGVSSSHALGSPLSASGEDGPSCCWKLELRYS